MFNLRGVLLNKPSNNPYVMLHHGRLNDPKQKYIYLYDVQVLILMHEIISYIISNTNVTLGLKYPLSLANVYDINTISFQFWT